MRSLAHTAAAWGYAGYARRWDAVVQAGERQVALDARAPGWRYLSLNTVVLSPAEAQALRRLTGQFGRLLDRAVEGILAEPDWWSDLAWPWAALELARQEPGHPFGRCTLYGRFDWLLDTDTGQWQLVEYNADTPSGGRELLGLEPSVWRLHGGAGAGLARLGRGFAPRLVGAVAERLRAWHSEHPGGPGVVGVVSSHTWVEDMSQAWWLTLLLRRAGIPAVVGDVRDLTVRRGQVRLRDQPIGALYRFYPVERMYRHGAFGQLWEAALDGRLLVLNGLRGFLAQSKGVLAWLWAHRGDPCLDRGARALIEDHLPPTVVARHWNGALDGQVVKHVNGREGNEVAFGDDLPRDGWEARLLEGGYVVQRRVYPVPVADVRLDEWPQRIEVVEPRYACVGAFCIDGQFGGCYTRLDGPITTGRAVYVPTFMGS